MRRRRRGLVNFVTSHPDITSGQTQYKVKTENTPSRRTAPAAPFGRGGACSNIRADTHVADMFVI